MASKDAPQKQSLILRMGAIAGAIAAILGVLFTLKPDWKPKESTPAPVSASPNAATPQVTASAPNAANANVPSSPIAPATNAPAASASQPNNVDVNTSPPLDVKAPAAVDVGNVSTEAGLRTEIKAQYDELDALLVRQGVMGLFTKMSSNWKSRGTDGTVATKDDVMQIMMGQEEKNKLVGITTKVTSAQTALEFTMPQADGTVVARVTRKLDFVINSPKGKEKHSSVEGAIEMWKKENGRWLIVGSEKQ